MWKTFQHDDQLYMIKINENENVEVYLTELINIWHQTTSKESILEQFQESNPLFDIKVDEAVTEVINLVNNISNVNVDILKSSETLQLNLKSQKSEFNVEFTINFKKASSEIFLKEITVPLMQTVKYLEEQQKMLCNLIFKKDRELEEFKLEKGDISRDDLITDKFDETLLGKNDNRSMINIFGNSESFWSTFVEQYGDIQAAIEDVKKDPWNHIKRKRQIYSAKTITKKGKGIDYNKNNSM